MHSKVPCIGEVPLFSPRAYRLWTLILICTKYHGQSFPVKHHNTSIDKELGPNLRLRVIFLLKPFRESVLSSSMPSLWRTLFVPPAVCFLQTFNRLLKSYHFSWSIAVRHYGSSIRATKTVPKASVCKSSHYGCFSKFRMWHAVR